MIRSKAVDNFAGFGKLEETPPSRGMIDEANDPWVIKDIPPPPARGPGTPDLDTPWARDEDDDEDYTIESPGDNAIEDPAVRLPGIDHVKCMPNIELGQVIRVVNGTGDLVYEAFPVVGEDDDIYALKVMHNLEDWEVEANMTEILDIGPTFIKSWTCDGVGFLMTEYWPAVLPKYELLPSHLIEKLEDQLNILHSMRLIYLGLTREQILIQISDNIKNPAIVDATLADFGSNVQSIADLKAKPEILEQAFKKLVLNAPTSRYFIDRHVTLAMVLDDPTHLDRAVIYRLKDKRSDSQYQRDTQMNKEGFFKVRAENFKAKISKTCLHGYDVMALLGSGTFGVVHQACDIDQNCNYAIKMQSIESDSTDGEDISPELERWRSEAKITEMFSEMYGIGPKFVAFWECEDIGFIVTDRWDGSLKKGERLTPDQIAKLEVQLRTLNDNGWVHSDALEKNILVKRNRTKEITDVTLTDFGLTKTIAEWMSPTVDPPLEKMYTYFIHPYNNTRFYFKDLGITLADVKGDPTHLDKALIYYLRQM
jgi:tRNA A-37 threonylcarbamoyl transferase component Bud32